MADRSFYQGWVEILPDFSRFNNLVKSNATTTFASAGNAGGESFKKGFTGSVFGGSFLGTFAANIASGIASVVGRGIQAGVDYATEGITLAGGLSESINAVQVAYGDLNEEVLELSQTAPRRLNITQNAFNGLAVRFQGFASKVVGPGGKVADVVDELTTRGADFASVFNLDVGEALNLFQSGLAGEAEPLRKYTIDLSAATVNAYALANGIGDGRRELTEAEKVQARYGALLEQTAKYEGDLANTRGSYANLARELNVQLEEAQTRFGTALLPTATDVLEFANDELVPILSTSLETVGPQISQSLKDALPEIEATIKTIAEGLPAAIDAGSLVLNAVSTSIEGDTDFRGIVGGFGEDGVVTRQRELYEELQAESREFGWSYARSWEYVYNALDLAWNGHYDTVKNQSRELQAVWNGMAIDVLRDLDAKAIEWIGVGERWGDGLAEGFRNSKLTVREEAALLAGEAIQASRNAMGIRSPSRVAMELGGYWAQGMAIGMERGRPIVENASLSMLSMPTVEPATVLGLRGDSTVEINAHGVDPHTVTQMIRQELSSARAGFTR